MEQTNHSDKGLSLKTPRLTVKETTAMDQWINDLDLILQVSSQIKKNIKNPENFKGVPHIEPIKPLNPYPALRAPWHCENSHLDAKPKAPAIVDFGRR